MESTGTKPNKLEQDKIIGFKSPMTEFPITQNTIIYSLGIGFNDDQLNKNHQKFTYELNDDYSVFPTYASVIPINDLGNVLLKCPGIPEFNLMSLLHGEEWVDIFKPFPTSGSIKYQSEIIDVEDKGKGTVFCIHTKIFDNDQSVIASATANLFVRGLKGEGAKSKGPLKYPLPKIPTSEPHKSSTYKTYNNQALYYRIGGNDLNPLHADPDMAAMGGFDKPILHGLCTFGMTARAAYDLYFQDDVTSLTSIKARMTSHVFPGETLSFNFWKGNGNNIIFSVKTVERGTQVLVGEITLKKIKF
jgi:acyl dehydratase